MSKPTFGSRTVADCIGKLQDPKVLAGAKECLEAGRHTWCMPVQLRKFDEGTIREAMRLMGVVNG